MLSSRGRLVLLLVCFVLSIVMWHAILWHDQTRESSGSTSRPPEALERLQSSVPSGKNLDNNELLEAVSELQPSSLVLHRGQLETCTNVGVTLVPRGKADAERCASSSPPLGEKHTKLTSCLNWTTFPSVQEEGSEPCDFLCRQASEVRPAIHKSTMLKSHAVVETSTSTDNKECTTSFSLVSPPDCLLSEKRGNPLRLTSILMIGHSHTRFLASMLCMMLNASSCRQLDDQFRNISYIRQGDLPREMRERFPMVDDNVIRLVFVQANYHYGVKLSLLRQMLGGNDAGMQQFTHVIFSRGSWDLLFYDRPPIEIAADLESSLRSLLSQVSSSARIIAHVPHFCHPKPASGKQKKKDGSLTHPAMRAAWRRTCFSEPRLLRMRDINLCALHKASNGDLSVLRRIELYDTYSVTKTPLALQFVDELGHHYQDVFLEYLAMKFLSEHICPAQTEEEKNPQRLFLNVEQEAHSACLRVAEASGNKFRINHECACHHPTERREAVCKKFGRSVPDSSRRS